MNILSINSSILGSQSASRELTAAILRQLADTNPGATVVDYDLAAEPFAHLGAADLMAFQGRAPQDAAAGEDATRNARALDDFLAADIIVVGAPMYNFTVPSQLKAWIDRILVAGKTFRYTAAGVEGLAPGKHVIIASSRGGFYTEGHPAAVLDNQENYLRGVFGFMGITHVDIIRAEGIAVSPELRKTAMADAMSDILRLAA